MPNSKCGQYHRYISLLHCLTFSTIWPCTLFSCFVWAFTPYQRYFSYLTATVHKPMFPGLYLTSPKQVHYPDTGGQSLCYSHNPDHQGGKATTTSFKDYCLSQPGIELPLTRRTLLQLGHRGGFVFLYYDQTSASLFFSENKQALV